MTPVQRIAPVLPPPMSVQRVNGSKPPKMQNQMQYSLTAKTPRTPSSRRREESVLMVKVNVQPDCGNAPKKLFIRDFMIAFANSDTPSILDCLADDAVWEMVGERTLNGKSEVEAAQGKM